MMLMTDVQKIVCLNVNVNVSVNVNVNVNVNGEMPFLMSTKRKIHKQRYKL